MLNHVSSLVSANLLNTVISLVVVFVIFLLVNLFFIRKIENLKDKKRIRIRSFYVAVLTFLFLMARIWVDGFMHLVAVLGLVSAGLVVTNKETIMNLVGWLIITWRGVFSEDDLIQIQAYKGYVKSIGMLYITLQEVSDTDFSRLTGKEIKVPNGLTSNNSVINYSQSARLVSCDFQFKLPVSEVKRTSGLVLSQVEKLLEAYYKGNKSFTQHAITRFDKTLKNKLNLSPVLTIGSDIEMSKPVTCVISFYCFIEDKAVLLEKMTMGVLRYINPS